MATRWPRSLYTWRTLTHRSQRRRYREKSRRKKESGIESSRWPRAPKSCFRLPAPASPGFSALPLEYVWLSSCCLNLFLKQAPSSLGASSCPTLLLTPSWPFAHPRFYSRVATRSCAQKAAVAVALGQFPSPQPWLARREPSPRLALE